MSTAVLRQQLFGEKPETQEQPEQAEEQNQGQEQKRSEWVLYEVEPAASERERQSGRDNVHVAVVEKQLEKMDLEPDIEEYETRAERYQRMHREVLLESLQALREGQWLYSRRIISIWNYQREQLRFAG